MNQQEDIQMDLSKLYGPYQITEIDPWLAPHAGDIELRMNRFKERRWQLVGDAKTLTDFANGYLYFGFHRTQNGWVFREWLPGADEVRLIGDFNDWNRDSHPLDRGENGVWEITLNGEDALKPGSHIKLWVCREGNWFERLPAYTTMVDMDEDTKRLCTLVRTPEEPFEWTDAAFIAEVVDPDPVLVTVLDPRDLSQQRGVEDRIKIQGADMVLVILVPVGIAVQDSVQHAGKDKILPFVNEILEFVPQRQRVHAHRNPPPLPGQFSTMNNEIPIGNQLPASTWQATSVASCTPSMFSTALTRSCLLSRRTSTVISAPERVTVLLRSFR